MVRSTVARCDRARTGARQRMDWLFQILAQLACIVSGSIRSSGLRRDIRFCRESERACDDAVLRLGVDARDYATHLFEIARDFCQSNAWSPALAMARRSALEERFTSLLKAGRNRNPAGTKSAVLIALAALITVIPVAAMRISNGGDAAVPVMINTPLHLYTAMKRGVRESKAKSLWKSLLASTVSRRVCRS